MHVAVVQGQRTSYIVVGELTMEIEWELSYPKSSSFDGFISCSKMTMGTTLLGFLEESIWLFFASSF